MKNKNIDIDKLRNTEMEIMDVIHDICIEYNLKYSLAYGTLLGAVRHHGFIPWDDDIDIMMPREDYNKLLDLWNKVAPKEYLLQTYENEIDYTNNFAKIRKNHTAFIQTEDEKTKKYHKGIFVDVFPVDKVANNNISKKIQTLASLINMLYTRGHGSGKKGLISVVENILLCLGKNNYRLIKSKTDKYITKWIESKTPYKIFVTFEDAFIEFPNTLFDELIDIEFENRFYKCSKYADEYLKIRYGDYMQLPPVEQRTWTHHPIVCEFTKNFEEL